ncbi:uncharacterized protein LOC119374323 [Rhipicephalus sanguineus]|uniref:uncharacterized protein LOC119374323 n=1 Tax=Rhipicephalus sanguineus TaxID=34632 RepID=UPI0018942DE2|nr:uncharacterized protein LOC119374323 [Rhipicephalus sanguineus]
MLPSITPTRPWEELGIAFFHLNGQDYVLLVDYRSRFPKAISLRSTTAPAVINTSRAFSRAMGFRDWCSDDGRQFAASRFSAFAEPYSFRHVTSSPHIPQSNEEVEQMAPADLGDEDFRRRQASDFNRRHAARTLRPLKAGQQVWVQDVNSPATFSWPAQRPRSYVVETPTSVRQRNQMHLVPTTGRPAQCTNRPPRTPVAARNSTASPHESTSTAEAPPGFTSTPLVSRFGTKIRRPKRLDL